MLCQYERMCCLASITEMNMLSLYKNLKCLRRLFAKYELDSLKSIDPKDAASIADVDRLLPIVEKHIIMDLNRSILDV